ncbi:Hypothetical protein FKW44_003247 [Caligus rogercresseyi]|uniref:Uncharacterized protein n=1 Tax=Caligus rogercresseyi TaxID=217165 RepID=A0A7T8KLC4_CALRO|nr:Hypothetical protein FKW44_003247 [Caligus rogercresseyi]
MSIILFERVPSLPWVVDGRLGVVEELYHLLWTPPGTEGSESHAFSPFPWLNVD